MPASQEPATTIGPVRRFLTPGPAAQNETDFPGLSDLVEATYRTLVASFIAGEERLFHDTE